jgi:hypothetical protein
MEKGQRYNNAGDGAMMDGMAIPHAMIIDDTIWEKVFRVYVN